MICRPEGPIPARLMLVGEAPGYDEERTGRPFQGVSGQELNRMLGEAGITRSECFITNVIRQRPKDNDLNQFIAKTKKDITSAHREYRGRWVLPPVMDGVSLLAKEIKMVQPSVIIALGNTSLWALTGISGITKWRGSMLYTNGDMGHFKCIPSYHPAAVLREWSWRAVAINDLRRAAKFRGGMDYPKPTWNFIIRPSFDRTMEVLRALFVKLTEGTLRLSFDLETRGGHIACAGLSWSLTEAICIPFMCVESPDGYWNSDHEAEIIWLFYQILTHPNAQVVGQNILYDAQYTWRHWHFVPRVTQDCMISQHSIFSDLPKSLAFQASMYCNYYSYWKDEGKDWDPKIGEDQLWRYNCEDCVYTDEGGRVELDLVQKLGLNQVHEFQQALFWPVLQTMQRGIRIDLERRNLLIKEVSAEVARRKQFILDLLGHPLNPASPKQMHSLFYGDLGQTPVMTRAKKGVPSRATLNDDALQTISIREPLLKPLINAISDIRTMGIFLSNFLEAELDEDGRMRCAYNIGGSASGKSAPKTYRLSSSENAFGSGTNLQNVPSEKSKSLGKAAARGSTIGLGDPYSYPNIRSMFIPDPGYTFFDGDLDRADLQVVVWEADDPMLKAALRMGVDIHTMNAYVLQNKSVPPLEELVETHPKYLDWRRPMKMLREFAKVFCHGCVTGDHDVLTRNGWVSVADISDEEEIAIWDAENKFIHFEKPAFWNRDIATKGENLVLFKGEAYSQLVTSNHRMPFSTDKSIRVSEAEKLLQIRSARLPKSGWYCGHIHAEDIKLIVAFIADGSIDERGNVYFHFHKDKKKNRLRDLLQGYEFSEYPDKFYVPHRSATFTRYGKTYDKWILYLDGSSLDKMLDEQEHWDGTIGPTGAINVSSVNRESLEWLRTAAHLRNRASQYQGQYKSGFGSIVHRISINNRPMARLSSLKQALTIELDRDVKVYCPKTTTGFFLVKREGKISVTGNTNYGGQPRTMAAHTGWPVKEVERAQGIWFGAHPGIKRWHDRVKSQINRSHFIENRFGYRWYIFDRVDSIVPEAIAWVPQSTVSVVINKIWMRIYKELPEVQVLLQVHDSLGGQVPTKNAAALVDAIIEAGKVEIPYEDPLTIPFSVKTSEVSWGDCK